MSIKKTLQQIPIRWFLWGAPVGLLITILGGKEYVWVGGAGVLCTFVIAPLWAVVVHDWSGNRFPF